MGSILAALTSVHAAGIIHRDLKPANVMFRDDGTIALVDFGSARRDADPVAKTLAGVVIGTPYYLSPEQALGGTADERSDLYSVGVMLYELLVGQRMYAAGSLVALFEMHKNAPIPKLPEIVARHQRFLERLVAKKPDERYRSAAEALAALMEHSMSEARTPADRLNGASLLLRGAVAFLRAASNSSPGFHVGICIGLRDQPARLEADHGVLDHAVEHPRHRRARRWAGDRRARSTLRARACPSPSGLPM